ncbi:MAG: NTP transferase domain-containing protein [Synechococcaceae cyanobacterium]
MPFPMPEPGSALPPLRVCLLSGGASRRMGEDKALLPHPEGGCWLERSLSLLAGLELPITLLSCHPRHLELARQWHGARVRVRDWQGLETKRSAESRGCAPMARDWPRRPAGLPGEPGAKPPEAAAELVPPQAARPAPPRQPPMPSELGQLPAAGSAPSAGTALSEGVADLDGVAERESAADPGFEALAEPPPWEGPLLALHRLMPAHPEQRLLLCPVDMPWLTLEVLQELVAASAMDPRAIQLAHDGERLQPLLGIYPSDAQSRQHLAEAIAKGERRLQSWLKGQPCRDVRLEAGALRNVNRPQEWFEVVASN